MSRLVSLTVSAMVLGAFAAARPALADGSEFRIATLAPENSSWAENFDKQASEIREKTGGRVNFKYFKGGSQGDERDYIRKIKLGQLDGATITSVGLSMIDDSIRVLELPMMFDSLDELDYVSERVWPHFQKKFEAKGFLLLDRGDVGWVYYMSKNKVESLADLKAQKLWMWGEDGVTTGLFKKLGIDGVPLGVPEVDAGLAAGKVNAIYGSPYASVALQWYTKVKYMTSMPISYSMGATVVSMNSMKGLSAEDRKMVEDIGKAQAKKLRKIIRKANEEAKATMAHKGVTIVTSPPAMVEEFSAISQGTWKDLVGKVYSQEELDMVLKYRDEYRAKHKK